MLPHSFDRPYIQRMMKSLQDRSRRGVWNDMLTMRPQDNTPYAKAIEQVVEQMRAL